MALSACSPVLSERTDEAEWLRFRGSIQTQTRTPASDQAADPVRRELNAALLEVPVRSIFLECSLGAEPESCYRKQLGERLDSICESFLAKDSNLSGNRKIEARDSFLEANSFPEVQAEVERFHQGLLSGIEISTREQVKVLMKSCSKSAKNGDPKFIRECLDSARGIEIDLLLTRTAERLGLRFTARGAREWIKFHQITPLYDGEVGRIAITLTEK